MISRYRISRTVTPAASMALVTLDQAKLVLGITDTSQDAALMAQINQVSAAIHRYCDHILVQQGYRDQFRYVCNWMLIGEPLPLRQYPLALDTNGYPVVAVVEDGASVDPASIEANDERGYLYRIDSGGAYGWTGLLITVDYTAGYDPVPEDLQAAALEWLSARWYSVGEDPALRSETIPDLITQVYNGGSGSDAGGGAAMPAAVRDLLAPYVVPAL
jgi:hypothetical protein